MVSFKKSERMERMVSKTSGRSLIVGGDIVDEPSPSNDEWPLYASSFAWTGIGGYGWGCGGSLIHSDVVLTAAHCQWVVHSNGFWIGTYKIDGSQGGVFFSTAQIAVHPQYNDQHVAHNDIMLVKLNDTVGNVIQYYDYNVDPTIPIVDSSVRVVGFGVTQGGGGVSQNLRQVDINIVENETCRMFWPTLNSTLHLCAGTDVGGKDACDSDSGSPLFVVNQGMPPMQVGIVADGIGCGRPGIPALYTRISTYASWIHDNVCNMSSTPPDSCQTTTTSAETASFFAESFIQSSFWSIATILLWVSMAVLAATRGHNCITNRRRYWLGYQDVANAETSAKMALSV